MFVYCPLRGNILPSLIHTRYCVRSLRCVITLDAHNFTLNKPRNPFNANHPQSETLRLNHTLKRKIPGLQFNAGFSYVYLTGGFIHEENIFTVYCNRSLRISDCYLFVYVGGESDEWADGVLKVSAENQRRVINLLDVLGDSVKPEEIVDGMQHEHHHEHSEPDEHVWLSLRNAEIICRKLADTLSEIDPSHKEIYAENLRTYAGKLSSLDKEYTSMVKDSERKIILVADRFPFRYLADDYGLKYYAAFSGCSTESKASFETVIFLAQKADELNLPCVIKIDGTNHKIAETVVNSSKNHDRRILVLDSMQSAAMNDIKAGKTYLSTMRSNLEILKEALN